MSRDDLRAMLGAHRMTFTGACACGEGAATASPHGPTRGRTSLIMAHLDHLTDVLLPLTRGAAQ